MRMWITKGTTRITGATEDRLGVHVRRIPCVAALIALVSLLLTPCRAVEAFPMPIWPREFRLTTENKVEFAFPVTQAGNIMVDVEWEGRPLTMVIRDPQGNLTGSQIGIPPPVFSPKASVSYPASESDIGKGLMWTVTLAPSVIWTFPVDSKSDQQADDSGLVGKGHVSVKTPPADEAACSAKLLELRAQRVHKLEKKFAQAAGQIEDDVEAALRDLRSARVAELASLEKKLKSRMQEGELSNKKSAAKPVIKTLSGSSGEAGEPVLITGSGFCKSCEVHFATAEAADVTATIVAVTSRHILVRALEPSPTYSGSCRVYVKCGKEESSSMQYDLKPQTDYACFVVSEAGIMEDSAFMGGTPKFCLSDAGASPEKAAAALLDSASNDAWTVAGNSIIGKHIAGAFVGSVGSDEYFKSFSLKNGWRVESICSRIVQDPNSIEANARIVEDRKGTSSCYVRIDWWNSPPEDGVVYILSYILAGPKGLSYR
ncbi:MAG: hypothetical protein HYX78_01075 [Armatimonadetes bacterium]|nr:hypothetical protein [Armatimonadota bacterium]